MSTVESVETIDYESRLSRTEANVEKLATSQDKLERTVKEGFDRVFEAIDRQGDRSSAQRAGTFGTLSTVAGIAITVILGIGAAIGSGYVRDLGRLEAHQLRIEATEKELASEVNGREFDRGQNYQRIRDLTESAEKLDTRLQIEMRLVNNTTEAKLVELDHRLQGEIKNAFDRASEERQRMRERIMLMEEEIKDTRETSARLQERVGIHKTDAPLTPKAN